MSEFIIRKATKNDSDELYDLIIESTGAKTSLTRENFRKDLAGVYGLAENDTTQDQSSLGIDKDLWVLNCSVCQAYLAIVDDQVIGYVLFHYFYSPWKSRLAFIDDIYVRPSYRRRGK